MSNFTLIDLLSLLVKGLSLNGYDHLRVLWRTKQLDAIVEHRRANDGSKFAAEVDDVCPYIGGYQYLIARFIPAVKGWPKTDSLLPEDLDLLTPPEQELVDAAHVHELVGDLSEGLLHCSYNDGDIRRIWCEGKINDYVSDALVDGPGSWEYEKFTGLTKNHNVEDNNYQDQLTRLVGLAGGWPANFSSAPKDLDPLTTQERELVEAFKVKMAPVVSDRTVGSVNNVEVINVSNSRHSKPLLSEADQRAKIGMAEYKREQRRAKRLKNNH